MFNHPYPEDNSRSSYVSNFFGVVNLVAFTGLLLFALSL